MDVTLVDIMVSVSNPRSRVWINLFLKTSTQNFEA